MFTGDQSGNEDEVNQKTAAEGQWIIKLEYHHEQGMRPRINPYGTLEMFSHTFPRNGYCNLLIYCSNIFQFSKIFSLMGKIGQVRE